jgi:photosystem II stability/assembly factor-like uncharacterized protein
MQTRHVPACLFGIVLALQASPGIAQTATQASLVAGVSNDAVLDDLALRPIGPAVMSGRIADIDVANIPGERLGRVLYTATAGGGVWKSINAGVTWQPIFDEQPAASIGDVTVAPSNPDIVWVGSGESNNLRSSSWGNGIYKSTDGGETWAHMGLPTSQHVPRILVHPTNPDIVYVAAMGPLWRSGGERGVYKTTNGGVSWTRVLNVNETTGATDLVFDPTNPDVIYAATMERERKAYSFVAGGAGSGIFKTTDGGVNWRKLERGLPTGDKGRIGVDVSLTQPRTLYAFVDAQDGGVFRSDDGGDSWTRQSNLNTLPWFTGQVRADTENPDRVYHLGQAFSVSDDGGRNWRRIGGTTHADYHAMWINPNDANHLLVGNDGGFFHSHDAGETWEFAVNLPVSTFYAIGVDMRDPYWVYGGLQDNGTWGAPVSSRRRTGIGNADWVNVGGGDGFYAQIDPTDPLTMYSESQNGALQRVDLPTDERKSIRPPNEVGLTYRFNWSSPLVISRYDNRTLYFGGNYLFKSTNRGDSWTRLGEDLTRNLERDTLPIMGLMSAGGFRRHEGTAAFGNIATIAESPIRRGLLYIGTDDGVIQMTRDDGQTWQRMASFPGVPNLTYVSRVVASAHAEGTVYATMDNHRDNDFRPYVLKSTDFGNTWTSIASNLPEGSVQVIVEHHRNPDLLFVGTEFGVFTSIDGGGSWTQMKQGFPTVAVHDMLIHPRENDLVVGTHGRGIWVLDDITPLESLAAANRTRQATLFGTRAAVAYNRGGGPGSPGDREFFAPNPPLGAMFTYLLPAGATGSATLAILDANNTVVRELPVPSTPGVHRIVWDLRWTSPTGTEPERRDDDAEEDGLQFGGPPPGPMVGEGVYTAQLRIADGGPRPRVASQTSVQVRRDPAARLTAAQYADLLDWRTRAYNVQREANTLVRELTEARQNLTQAIGSDSTSSATQGARQARTTLDEVLERLRGRTGGGRGGFGGRGGGGQPNVLGMVNGPAGVISASHFPVSDAQKQAITDAAAALDAERARAQQAIQAANAARSRGRP